jgi:hypothetical protein
MTLDLLMEVVGWIGALLILAGYGLLSAGKLDAKSPAYQWLNVVGAVGFIANRAGTAPGRRPRSTSSGSASASSRWSRSSPGARQERRVKSPAPAFHCA